MTSADLLAAFRLSLAACSDAMLCRLADTVKSEAHRQAVRAELVGRGVTA